MDEKEATRICGQCHKEVAEVNFTLHESHCRRFLCLCPDCDEPIPRDQMKEHREKQHAQVRCSKCNQKMERCHLLDHESEECEERLKCCQFCQLELPWKELEEHSLVCGSRTELCRDCGRYVTLKDQLEHVQTCAGAEAGAGAANTISSPHQKKTLPVTRRGCEPSFPGEIEHELEWVPTSSWDLEEAEFGRKHRKEEEEEEEDDSDFSRELRFMKVSSMLDRASRWTWGGEDPDQISTCPHCDLALPLTTLRWHEVKCQIHIHMK
ncbi:hypothetical protein LDENG_00138940 [Lucifuga dentata]|nr:hypothetical protein LDENG_00138940 [Lucifuga dentata]